MATQPANPQEVTTGRRRHSRLRLQLPARLITLGKSYHVTLIDLSLTGAKVALDVSGPRHGDAVLEWGGFDAFCSIAWSAGRFSGLDFEEPLPARLLIATRDLGDTTEPVDADRAAARAWAAGVIRL